MNEPETLGLFQWVAGGVMGIVAWVLKRHVGRMDSLESRTGAIEQKMVDDEKLENTITRIERKMDESSKEIREEFRAVHKRIDEAFKR